MNPRFRQILFDLDGTLIDSTQCGIQATLQAFEIHGLPAPDSSRITALMGIPIERSFAILTPAENHPSSWEPLFKTFRDCYSKIAERNIDPFPGIVKLLKTLNENGVRSMVVTSKKRSVAEANCRSTKIIDFLEGVIGSDSVERFKPDPAPVFAACDALGLKELSCVLVIGDAPVDIQMGQAAGTSTCAALWGAGSPNQLLEMNPTFSAQRPEDLLAIVFGKVQISI
jgi:phosphoglycolate phosphatase